MLDSDDGIMMTPDLMELAFQLEKRSIKQTLNNHTNDFIIPVVVYYK